MAAIEKMHLQQESEDSQAKGNVLFPISFFFGIPLERSSTLRVGLLTSDNLIKKSFTVMSGSIQSIHYPVKPAAKLIHHNSIELSKQNRLWKPDKMNTLAFLIFQFCLIFLIIIDT